jgi:hypothetical protein
MRERTALPKSRKRKKKGETSTPGAVRMTPEVHEMLLRHGICLRPKETSLIGVEGLMDAWPADRRQEWNDAVKEYELIEQASKEVDRPDRSEGAWANNSSLAPCSRRRGD